MNFDPHSSSGGDGRRPRRHTHDLGLHKAAPKKSKKRHNRQHLTDHPPPPAAQAPVTPSTPAPTRSIIDELGDPEFFYATMMEGIDETDDTNARMAQSNAQGVASQALAPQAWDSHAMATQAMGTPARFAQDAAARSAPRDEDLFTTPAQAAHPSASSSAGASSSRSSEGVKCPHCRRRFASIAILRRHVGYAHNTGGLRHCFRCRFVSQNFEAFRTHLRTHELRYRCPMCGAMNDLPAHTEHVSHCPASLIFGAGPAESAWAAVAARQAASAAQSSSSTPLPSPRAHPSPTASAGASSSRSEPAVHCPHCHRQYTSRRILQRHVRSMHDNDTSHHCHRCSFVASEYEMLRVHMRNHELRYRCQRCGQRNELSQHIEHVNNCRGSARAAAGPAASAALASSSTTLPASSSPASTAASAGASSSRTEAVVQCPHCHQAYTSLDNLRRHVRRTHDEGSFRFCHRCRFGSDDSEAFRAHRYNHEHRHRCPRCGERNELAAHSEHMRNCRR